MAKLKLESIVNPVLDKYGLPRWMAPYAYSYVKDDPINAVKKALSFIEVKRKKGSVTKRGVFLPNGHKFDTASIGAVLNIFLYTETRVYEIVDEWLSHSSGHDYAWYRNYFSALAENDKRHAKAIKNLMEGLGIKVAPVKKESEEPFKYIQQISSWPDRLIALEVILKRPYSTFGIVFYKVFYSASPEFMRSFVKVFQINEEATWESNEIDRVINEGLVEKEHVIEMERELLSRFYKSIYAYSSIAKREGLEKEVKFITEVAAASPMEFLVQHGFDINVEEEIKRLDKSMG